MTDETALLIVSGLNDLYWAIVVMGALNFWGYFISD